MHLLILTLHVKAEPQAVEAVREFATDAEVITFISEYLTRFVTPDRGEQVVNITIRSAPPTP